MIALMFYYERLTTGYVLSLPSRAPQETMEILAKFCEESGCPFVLDLSRQFTDYSKVLFLLASVNLTHSATREAIELLIM